MCHVYVRGDSLAGVVISDHEYPNRVSHTLITKVLDEFAARYPSNTWTTLTEATTDFPQINTYLAKYQNPQEADSLTKMQNNLDETTIILVTDIIKLKFFNFADFIRMYRYFNQTHFPNAKLEYAELFQST